jgi:hypothetical protein
VLSVAVTLLIVVLAFGWAFWPALQIRRDVSPIEQMVADLEDHANGVRR